MQVDGGKNVNKELGDDLTAWAFHESLVIKSNYLQHRAPDSNETNPQVYRVGDPVTVSFSLSAFDPEIAAYVPFSTPAAYPVQLEVNMLDPYIRTSLPESSHSSSETIYSKTFDLPDRYGVFNFKIQHHVPGYTYIYEREQFTIRHRQHDEYPRFISGAWSYYTGWLSVSFGFLVFCAVWLYHTPKPAEDSLKKTQ
jgi:oligosaccharyltransferase complex subunit beta